MDKSQRLQDLKDNRVWLHGTLAEKAEYEALKNELAKDPVAINSNQMIEIPAEQVTLSKKELDEYIASKVATIQAENDGLKARQANMYKEMGIGSWQALAPEVKRKHYAWLKLYQPTSDDPEGLVVYWKQFEVKKNPLTGMVLEQIYTVRCLYDDNTTKDFKMSILELGGLFNREKVEIIDMKKEKMAKIHGKVKKALKDENGYTHSLNFQGQGAGDDFKGQLSQNWADLLEVVDNITVTIQRESGQTYTMPAKFLNS